MTELVLASASGTRQSLLRQAGVPFAVDPPAIDEDEVKESLRAERAPPRAVAETLAELKARRVALRHAGALADLASLSGAAALGPGGNPLVVLDIALRSARGDDARTTAPTLDTPLQPGDALTVRIRPAGPG